MLSAAACNLDPVHQRKDTLEIGEEKGEPASWLQSRALTGGKEGALWGVLVCHRGTIARKYLLQCAKYPREQSHMGTESSSDNIPIMSLCVLLTPSQQCGCEPLQEGGARCQGAVL